ncbi:hypothetical protein D3C87_1102860 [compost metagenome]
MVAITSSACTVAPSGWTMLASTPLAGAGTSSVTLSVSSSTRISSRVTASPACFFHWISVASETDSESCGTFTSIAAMVFLF